MRGSDEVDMILNYPDPWYAPSMKGKPNPKRVALIAHDNLKPAMVAWARAHLPRLKKMHLSATGTTGARIESELPLKIKKFKSGPLGGDQQIGAKIAEGKMDLVIFFWDPLAPHPHDVDVKALLRIAAVYDVPMACNPSTADWIMRSIG
jgi:methylglyoxal synthase